MRKIHTKIEDLRKLVVSEIKACKRSQKAYHREGDWYECMNLESCINTYQFILENIDAQPEEEFDYNDPNGYLS